jgi:RNA polymerase sigma factor (sigma-70 family)
MEKMTDKDIEGLYKTARKLAWKFYQNHYGTHLDIEDLVQEAVIGYLQGRSMKTSMMDAFRQAAPLSRSQVNKIPIPIKEEYQQVDELSDDEIGDLDTAVLISQLREAISKLDKRTQEIMSRRFFYDETLKQLGKQHNLSQERIRQIINKAILRLRREYGV